MLMVGPSLLLVLSLLDQCGMVDRSGDGGDLWSVWCTKCRCINDLIRARLSHHVNGSGRGVDVRDDSLWRIPSPGVVVIAAAIVVGVAATTTIVGGGGLLGKGGECWKDATPQGALHTSAGPN